MKILIIDTTIDGSLIGGGHLYLPHLIKGLIAKGCDVHLVIRDEPNEKVAQKLYASGATIHNHLWKKTALHTDSARRFADWVNRFRPDLFLISSSGDVGWLVLPMLDPSIATVTIGHSNWKGYYEPAQHYRDFLTTAVGVSHEICDKYSEISGLDPARVTWIPYGIEVAKDFPLHNQADPLKLVFAGRVEESDKRISDVVAIIKQLDANGIAYQFDLIGDGSKFEWVKNALQPLIEKGKVNMPGWVSGEQVLQYFKDADVFLLTSSSEGFSISLIEAMANGCCPVVTNIPSGSVQLIRDGENGYLVDVGNTAVFTERLSYLVNHKDKLTAMRRAAWITGSDYGVDRMANDYYNCFIESIDRARKSPRSRQPDFPVMQSCKSKYPDWVRRVKVFAKDLGLIKSE